MSVKDDRLVEEPLQDTFYMKFLEFVERTVPVDQETTDLIADNCKLVTFPKGYRMLNFGSVCKYIYFIISGESVSYYIDPRGKTTTWFFHFNRPESKAKNLFAVDYQSFLSGGPAQVAIEALSPVTAIRFSASDVRALTDGSCAIERWLRILNEQVYMETQERITSLLTLSASERYERFLAKEPHLLNMFSHYLIATYLNVAPPSLSRIRKRLSVG